MSENGAGPIPEPQINEEYEAMLTLEELESLEEELEEVGFSSLSQVEMALSGYKGNQQDEQYQLLVEIRDRMLDLDVDNLREVRDHIRKLHQQLDQD